MTVDADVLAYVAGIRQLVEDRTPEHGVAGDDPGLAPLIAALDSAGVLRLATETIDMETPLRWLSATVAAIAVASPSAAFALASHFAGSRALTTTDRPGEEAAVLAAGVVAPPADTVSAGGGEIVLATLLDPVLVLALDPDQTAAAIIARSDLRAGDVPDEYSGLHGAGLTRLGLAGTRPVRLGTEAALSAAHDWAVLCSAVLLGIARASLSASRRYAADRKQFGSVLTDFAAIRSMLSEMAVRAEALESLLDRAVENGPASTASFAVAAESGRSAIRIALDAIQIHGGYGYIEEYAVARHLRDAMTVSARSGGRRLALAAMAAVELGAPPWRSSVDTSEKT